MPKAEEQYPPSEIAKFYVYWPLTGDITWRRRVAGMTFGSKVVSERGARQSNGKCAGRSALYDHIAGYKAVAIMGTAFLAHRAAWALHYGVWPEGWMDHINGDRTDNRIVNLRVVSPSENSRNSALSSLNRTGVPGVFYEAAANRWKAYINVNRRRIELGSHSTLESAVSARRAAEREFGFHPNHGRRKVVNHGR